MASIVWFVVLLLFPIQTSHGHSSITDSEWEKKEVEVEKGDHTEWGSTETAILGVDAHTRWSIEWRRRGRNFGWLNVARRFPSSPYKTDYPPHPSTHPPPDRNYQREITQT